MMNLHEHKDLFAEIIDEAASYFQYDPSHIEKDYWVTKMLKEVATSQYAHQAFFKGGTSLSKAYGIIKRFSEDLDMLVYSGDVSASKSKEKALNKKVCDLIVQNNADIYKQDLSKVGGNFRKLYFGYDNMFDIVGLKQHLEVEVKACDFPDKTQIYYPTDKRTISPILGDFLNKIGRQDLIKQFGLEPFDIDCISPRKTICDKISRLVKLSYRDNPIDEFSKHIRDFYDLHAILSVKEYRDFLHSEDFLDAMYRTTVEDQLMKNTKSDQPLDMAIIFKETESIIDNKDLKNAYNNGLKSLFFARAKMPDLKEIQETIKDIATRLESFESYRKKMNPQPGDEPKKDFSSITVYSNKDDDKMYIRYIVNGEKVLAKELTDDERTYMKNIMEKGSQDEIEKAKLDLAQQYETIRTNRTQSQSKNIKI